MGGDKNRAVELLKKAERWLQVVVCIGLLIISASVLAYTFYRLSHELLSGAKTIHAFVVAVQDILLVMIILEVFWTVTHYIETGEIKLEPFLYVAIISGVRGLLIQGTKAIELAESKGCGDELEKILIESAVHVGQILVLSIALYLLRKSRGSGY